MNFQDSFFETNAKRPKSTPLQKVSEGKGDRFILTDLKIICTCFGSNQPSASLEITTKNVTEKGVDLFIK